MATSVSSFLDKVQALCVERGIRLTPQRREVLGIIHSAEQPLGAYDILEKMAQSGRKPALPAIQAFLGCQDQTGATSPVKSPTGLFPWP